MTYVVKGKHSDGTAYRPPLELVLRWAEILELVDDDLRVFLASAVLEYGSEEYRRAVEELIAAGRV